MERAARGLLMLERGASNTYLEIIVCYVMGAAFFVEFLTTCSLKDFSTNVRACHLKKWEKKKLIGNLKLKYNNLVCY